MQCFIAQKIVDMPKVTKQIDVEDLMNLLLWKPESNMIFLELNLDC